MPQDLVGLWRQQFLPFVIRLHDLDYVANVEFLRHMLLSDMSRVIAIIVTYKPVTEQDGLVEVTSAVQELRLREP